MMTNDLYVSGHDLSVEVDLVTDGEIDQYNKKLYNRIISSGNKFFQTYKNPWVASMKYRAQNKN